jgi:hypothetical protein
MNTKVYFIIAFIFFVVILFISLGRFEPSEDANLEEIPGIGLIDDPINATYVIDGKEISLTGGKAEEEIMPGSATKIVTMVFGEPVYGDIDEDGDDDALMFIVQDPGGSGTFYYAALAINTDTGYQGTNAVFLGDRIAPQTVSIQNGIAIANYADRKKDEPMAERPSIGKSKYMVLKGGMLEGIDALSEGEMVFYGYLVYGHEVRSFRPCRDGSPEYWLMGDSLALKDLKEIYTNLLSDVEPATYTPLFVVISGKIVEAPIDGFGADYDYAISVTQLIRASRQGSCKSDLIIVEEPLAGTTISSPLTVKGKARGTWYFEGDFPLILTDWDGKIIAEWYATALDDWMVESFVPFEGVIEFEDPGFSNGYINRGTLIFRKDNPSGISQYDDALEIPVFFKE